MRLSRSMLRLSGGLLGALFAVAACAQGGMTLTHVHGLAFSGDGKRLLIPSHHGLAVYEDGRWSKAPGPQHDYMGFAATRERLYSSGHPAGGSGFANPFGLIRSKDGGRTWEKLGLEGETDFHLLATGWNTNAIYVWNPEPSSRMKRTGLHYTLNDGLQWRPASAEGLAGKVHALGVHPDRPDIVAVSTSEGLYLSRNHGERFTAVAAGIQAFGLHFDLDGRHLWYGSFDGAARLTRVTLSGEKSESVALPPIGRDAVAYIAQNPKSPGEYAIATFERSVYLTKDAAGRWTRIAHRGKGE